MSHPTVLSIPVAEGPVTGTVSVPGSKSLTNRALIIAALADGRSELSGVLDSDDASRCTDCLRALGIGVERDGESAIVDGTAGRLTAPSAKLFVGNSGTTARFVSALIAAGGVTAELDGVPRMRERPIRGLLDLLASQGAAIEYRSVEGHLPAVIHGAGLAGGDMQLDASGSSQLLSAMLMTMPYAADATTVVVTDLVSRPYVDMTTRVMADFGVAVTERSASAFDVPLQRYRARRYAIEPDASSASYFFAAAAVSGGSVRIPGLGDNSLQGDLRFVEVLERMGCRIERTDDATEVHGPQRLGGVDVDMNAISDMVPTLAAIAPFAAGPVHINNVAHIRLKETDRIHAVVTELRRIGVTVDERQDGLTVHPSDPTGAIIETYDDHRIAMAFAVTGLVVPGISIRDPGCTAKTFPDFFEHLFELTDTPDEASRRTSSS